MVRPVVRILLLLISMVLIGYSGFFVYQKQKNALNFNAFSLAEHSNAIYFPDIRILKHKPDALKVIRDLGLPGEVIQVMNLLAGDGSINHPVNVKLSYNANDFILSIKGLSTFAFNKACRTDISGQSKKIAIGNKVYKSWLKDEFIALSNSPFNPADHTPFAPMKGNGDFFYTDSEGRIASYKVNKEHVFYTYTDTSILKGRAVNPVELLSQSPSDVDTLLLYASTRLKDDAELLFKTEAPEFFDWTDQALTYLKKDNYEIVIGLQNDEVSLKNRLEEMTLSQSIDSLLPDKIYVNNFEIMPFKFSGSWQAVFPFLQENLNFYCEYNNHVFLTGSLPGMYWLLRELQLGKTFSEKELHEHLTSNLNELRLSSSKETSHYHMMARIGKNIQIHFGLNETAGSGSGSSELEKTAFSYINQVDYLNVLPNQNTIILTSSNSVKAVDFKGAVKWEKTFSGSISISPQIKDVNLDGQPEIVLAAGPELVVLQSDGEALKGFPFQNTGTIHQFSVLNYDDQAVRILFNADGTIKNINQSGEIVTGWSTPEGIGKLNSSIHYNSDNGFDYISCITAEDSLIVLNRKGERRFKKRLKCAVAHPTPFISGQSNLSSARLQGYDHNQIYLQFLETGFLDSIDLKTTYLPEAVHWTDVDGQNLLFIELFDKLMVYNSYGIAENEIIKPVVNSKLVSIQSVKEGVFIFSNSQTNEVYLLDNYGNLKHKTPLLCSEIMTYSGQTLITVVEGKVIVYNF